MLIFVLDEFSSFKLVCNIVFSRASAKADIISTTMYAHFVILQSGPHYLVFKMLKSIPHITQETVHREEML